MLSLGAENQGASPEFAECVSSADRSRPQTATNEIFSLREISEVPEAHFVHQGSGSRCGQNRHVEAVANAYISPTHAAIFRVGKLLQKIYLKLWYSCQAASSVNRENSRVQLDN